MPRIPDAELERLKLEVSLERLVEGSGIMLKSRGADRVSVAPSASNRCANTLLQGQKRPRPI